MKYNKQLFDHINDQYNQVFSISEFIYDQLIEKTEDLNRFEDGTVITPALLKETGLVKKQYNGIKILGNGKLENKITIQANRFSSSALEKIKEFMEAHGNNPTDDEVAQFLKDNPDVYKAGEGTTVVGQEVIPVDPKGLASEWSETMKGVKANKEWL